MKDIILKNITKQNFVSRKFLKEQNITEKECYDIVYGSRQCKYCKNEAKFKNWTHGYLGKCESNICSKKQRAERTIKTNMEKYGVKNVSSVKEIQQRKLKTFKSNFGVNNISQLSKTQKSIRKTMEKLGKWIKLEDKNPYHIYYKAAEFKHGFEFTCYTTDKEKKLLNELGVYNNRKNKKGCVRDHLLSRRYGFENNIPTWIISHPANCEIIPHNENLSRSSRKEGDNLITFEELLKRINNFEYLS